MSESKEKINTQIGTEEIQPTYTSSENSIEDQSLPKESFIKRMGGILTCGCGFLSDGYQQGVMTMGNAILAAQFKGYNTRYKTMVSNSILVANIIGQIFFGFTTDLIGRKQTFTYTTVFIIVGVIICACANGSTEEKLFWMLIIGRGVLGVGIGGDYPAAASAGIETANEKMSAKKRTAPYILTTNFFIATGVPIATIVFLIVHEIWGPENLNGIWRTCFAVGGFIPLSIFYFRWKLEHASSYKANALKKKVPYLLIWKKYWKEFVATASMWFIMDMIVYPNNIFSTSILQVAIPNASLKKTGEWQLFLSSFSIFGVLLSCIGVQFFTRRQVLISGYLGYAVLSFIVGGAFEKFSEIPALLIVFYALLNMVVNFGPASLQSVVSSESYPTAVRGTIYGISAAIGKAGAAVGTEVFTPLQQLHGKRYTFILSGGLSILGAIVCWWGCPDYGDKNLDFLDVEFNQYLKENGWEGTIGEDEKDKSDHKIVNIIRKL
ncbi:Inorganic phosphate transporter [Wickerhamomyces ciferrii]|uniref:Inorganic phosphate transporter n=1 Tax=Wickerhamomyces ciferrii (strain ATCC 14091 / BCRC 22168 / CBS 111 / JCM 3599 / NBRC 0793 / NRRL Y-1031 F-60-10) TaxID=1206466 RepID=K0KP40_WICCF|nr:Inorganic phosphate transporter [Wickerhamomyces ciferrii]CCH42878.1 Inorganic phosphate transporter [Wickerhamomyces ciferrii]